MDKVALAKKVLAENEEVLYGVFGIIGVSDYFPPRAFLNAFLLNGYDPCDQDGRMAPWTPFALSAEEYEEVLAWWIALHPDAKETDLGAADWGEWAERAIFGE